MEAPADHGERRGQRPGGVTSAEVRAEEKPRAMRRRPGREPLRHCALPREADQQMGDGLVTERE